MITKDLYNVQRHLIFNQDKDRDQENSFLKCLKTFQDLIKICVKYKTQARF